MRVLIATEKGDQGPWDLKLAPGGLTDLDFLAQALVLAHASDHPSLLAQASRDVLAEAGRLGLLPEADGATARRSSRALHRDCSSGSAWRSPVTFDRGLGSGRRSCSGSQRSPACRTRRFCCDHLNETRAEVRKVFSREARCHGRPPPERQESRDQCAVSTRSRRADRRVAGRCTITIGPEALAASGCAGRRREARPASGRWRGRGRSPCGSSRTRSRPARRAARACASASLGMPMPVSST